MPLAIVCGLPGAGKTEFSKALKDFIEKNHPEYTVSLINDELLNLSKSSGYGSATEEKKSRAAFMSAVERSVSKTCIVIADGLNYIKGYRYQLYCIARAANTPHCAIHVLNSVEDCRANNLNRINGYPSEVFEELIERFEEPNNQTKWDNPLFSVASDHFEFEDICKVLCTLKTARPPSMSTAIKPGSSGDFVTALDRITQEVTAKLQAQMKPFGPSKIVLADETLDLLRPIPQGQLISIRRQFIHMNRLHPLDLETIPSLFINYIKSTLNQ